MFLFWVLIHAGLIICKFNWAILHQTQQFCWKPASDSHLQAKASLRYGFKKTKKYKMTFRDKKKTKSGFAFERVLWKRIGRKTVGKKKKSSHKNTEEKNRCKSRGKQPICSQDSNNQLWERWCDWKNLPLGHSTTGTNLLKRALSGKKTFCTKDLSAKRRKGFSSFLFRKVSPVLVFF